MAILAGTVIFGIVAHLLVTRLEPAATTSSPPGGGYLGHLLSHWVIFLANPTLAGNIAYAGLLVAIAVLTQLKGHWRSLLMAPTLYLAAFVWENALVTNPSVARLIILGALLIALMNARPQGLFGTSRIEIA